MADNVVPVSIAPPDRAAATAAPTAPASRRPATPVFRELPRQQSSSSLNLELLRDVELTVKIELGRARLRLEDVLRLGSGAIVELDRLAGDPVDVYVNDRLIARGDVVVVDDKLAVRLTEVVTPIQG